MATLPWRGYDARTGTTRGDEGANVEVYQSEINKRYGTKLTMLVTYYSQLMTASYGGSAREAGLDGHLIEPTQLQAIAAQPAGR